MRPRQRPWRHRRNAAIVAVAVAVIGGTACHASPPPHPASQQTSLPFSGLSHPGGVAVDASGAVYVADSGNKRVVKLASGSNNPAVLPFTGLNYPDSVAVDAAGAVYVTEYQDQKVVKLAAGSTTSTELPFTGLNTPLELDVDKSGAMYVADRGNNRVVRLAAS